MPEKNSQHDPLYGLSQPPSVLAPVTYPLAPTDRECEQLWDKYGMLPNIRGHSRCVAQIAETLAKRACALGARVDAQATRACGLLHDLAKTWCLTHRSSHAMLGASWVVMETGHQGIGQGVLLHVSWPWKLPAGMACLCLPLFVLYADKRVRHDQCVTLQERFEDLIHRYGKTREAREGIRASHRQALAVEKAFSELLGRRLDEDTFDCGRLVG